jgi:hypothetical protein
VSRRFGLALGLALAAIPTAACAGPPFLTDDPEPTDFQHWELYAPLFEADGSGENFAGALAAEINYGAAPDVQITVGLPVAYSHDGAGWRWGAGDLEASVKYRFYHDEAAGVQIAAFPGVTLPTATHGLGAGKVAAFLPVWAQKDMGPWSVFGGGGYAVNPGSGNRDYWTGGVAMTRKLGERWLVGAEIDRQGPDTVGGRASTSVGIGGIVDLKGPLRLLASGGPTWTDGGGSGFHAYAALGLDF